VSYLGRLLGQVLVEQGGEELFETEEQARELAKRLRDRVREAEGRAQTESFAAAISAMAARGVATERVRTVLERLAIEPVLTAHSTEISRRSILEKHLQVAACLDRLDNASLSPRERREVTDELPEAITVIWQSSELRSMRPRVIDKVRRTLFFFEEVLFDAAADVAEHADETLGAHNPDLRLPAGALRFASWAGGDQDGTPSCTSEGSARPSPSTATSPPGCCAGR
jgi:phosphoenolpyruvate carboxylase